MKNIFRKKENEYSQVFYENEVRTNRMLAIIFILLVFVILFDYMLTEIGVFTVNKSSERLMVLCVTPLFFLSGVLTLILKGNRKWLKHMLLASVSVACALCYGILTYNATLMLLLPVVASAAYYSSILTIDVSVISAVMYALFKFFFVTHGGLIDLNSVRLNDTTLIIGETLRQAVLDHGIDLQVYIHNTLFKRLAADMFIYFPITFLLMAVANRSRKMVIRQAELSKEEENRTAELKLATTIQMGMRPMEKLPVSAAFALQSHMEPAKEVGGDFYDYFLLGQGKLAVVMADVSGKGVPAAMLGAMGKTLISDRLKLGLSPAETLTAVNNELCQGNSAMQFITCWVGILDPKSGSLCFANAGHNPPALYNDGAWQLLAQKPGVVLGLRENFAYMENEIPFDESDRLFLYTDGVTEAENKRGEQFGEERMLATLENVGTSEPQEIIFSMMKDLKAFTSGAPQSDDITMLTVVYP